MKIPSDSMTYEGPIHGVPAAAVRAGRLLELWGLRVAQRAIQADAEAIRQARWGSYIARAAQQSREVRSLYESVR